MANTPIGMRVAKNEEKAEILTVNMRVCGFPGTKMVRNGNKEDLKKRKKLESGSHGMKMVK